MFDEARALAITMKMRKLSQSEMAKSLGVSQSYVANKLRLLKLDENSQRKIIEYGLTERHARALLSLEDEKERTIALERIHAQKLSVEQSEAMINFLKNKEFPKKLGKSDKLKATDLFLDNLKNSLESLSSIGISATCKITHDKRKIRITICIQED